MSVETDEQQRVFECWPDHSPTGLVILNEVVARYKEPHRHYHNLSHIAQVLKEMESANCRELAMVYAAWFHDVIYDPTRSDNEALSAQFAAPKLELLGCDSRVIERVVKAIHCTQHHLSQPCENSVDDQLKVFLDADMSIIGKPRAEYIRYIAGIRQEYQVIDPEHFAQGRRRFLSQSLERKSLYQSQFFYNRYERAARENIAWELRELTASRIG